MATEANNLRMKFELAHDAAARLRDRLDEDHEDAAASDTLTSVYYDTEDLALYEAGLSLRLRNNGDGRHVQLVEFPNGATHYAADHIEWEETIASERPDFVGPNDHAYPPVLNEKLRNALKPVFRSRVKRTSHLVTRGNAEIGVTIDDNKVDTGEHSAAFSEVEVALKRGEPSELFQFVWMLDETVPLRLAVEAEGARGYRLLKNEPEEVIKTVSIPLQAGMTSADAFRVIAHSCLHQVAGNERAMCAGNAAALHQMRVGLRRLRTALSVFSGFLLDSQIDTIKAEIKWMSRVLAPARELDVFLTEVVLPLRREYREEAGLQSLYRSYSAQRAKAYERARQAANSVRFRALMLELAAWIETGPWTMNQNEPARIARARPIAPFAVEELTRRRKKVKKEGKRLTQLNPAERHELRIRVKKLRYAAEFFSKLFPGKKRRKRELLASLKKLQDALGDVNDVAVQAGLRGEIIRGPKTRGGRAGAQRNQHRAFAAGLIIGHQKARLESLLNSAEDAYDDFNATKAFWKGFEPAPAPQVQPVPLPTPILPPPAAINEPSQAA
jgi:triphosphatase